MPEHIQYEDDELFNPGTHHEQSDVPVRPLLWSVVIFIVFAIVTHLVLGLMYKGFASMERKRMDPPQTAVTRPANADVPQNQPLLQPFPRVNQDGATIAPQTDTPVTDLQKMRAAEDEVLRSYGWVDEQKGIVRIPIEEAKKRLAAKLAVEGQTGRGAAAQPGTASQPTAPETNGVQSTTTQPAATPRATGTPASSPAGSAPSPAPPPGAGGIQ